MPNEKPVVLFDGECNFCRSQIDLIRRMDGKDRLVMLSLHDPSVRERFPDLTKDQLMEQMWIVTADGRRFGGAFAVRYLATILPILWPIMPLMYIPYSMHVWQPLYRFVARNRYRIAGRNCEEGGACSFHYHSPGHSKSKSQS